MTLPARSFSWAGRLSDTELFVVSVILVLLAGGVAGLFFVGDAIHDITDDMRDIQVSLQEIRRDISELRQDIGALRDDVRTLHQDVSGLRAETSKRFDVIKAR